MGGTQPRKILRSNIVRTEWTGRNPGKDKLRNEMWKMLVEEKIAIGEPYNEIPN